MDKYNNTPQDETDWKLDVWTFPEQCFVVTACFGRWSYKKKAAKRLILQFSPQPSCLDDNER